MTRYDYRNEYNNWDQTQIKQHLTKLKDDLLNNIGICKSNTDNLLKRITYLENKI